jgi:broad specificity phosphatase PhoE
LNTRRWIFLRHGQSEANAARVFSGHQDVALTEKGRAQAAAAGQQMALLLKGQAIDQVLVSSLQRAQDTARIALSAMNRPAPATTQTTDRLWERCLGRWQGRSIDELKASGDRARLLQWHGRAPEGESLRELALRVLPFLAAHDHAETTLVVCHGGVIRVALGLADGMAIGELGQWNPQNAVPILRDYVEGHFARVGVPG